MTGRPRVRAITGGHLQTRVIDYAHHCGLYVAHFRPMKDARGRWRTAVAADGAGYPDLTIVGPGGVLYREMKGATERSLPEQLVWADRLLAAGADFAVWRPRDWDSGAIQAQLQMLRRPAIGVPQ